MNLIDVERLVRRIGDLLDGRLPEEQARPLAQEYAGLVAAAALRLQQCAAMLDRGDATQALQLADSPPALLDLILRLGFARLGEWQDYCRKRSLPGVESLDTTFLRRLNDAYAQGITPNDPLYRRLREAMHSRDDLRIVDALRGILRRNPSDTATRQQLERFEARVLDAEYARLAAALDNGDEARVVGLAQDVEALDFDRRPSGDVWRAAQTVRCRVLLGQVARQRERDDWTSATALLEQVRIWVSEQDLDLGAEGGRARSELERWCEARRREAAEARDFELAGKELRELVEWCEQQAQSTSRPRLKLQRELRRNLEAAWQRVGAFHRGVDEDLARRWRKARDLVQDRIEGRERVVRRWLAVGVLAALAVAATAVRGFGNRRHSAELVDELKALREGRQLDAGTRAVERATRQVTRIGGDTAPLRLELATMERWLGEERERHARVEDGVKQLDALAREAFKPLTGTPERVEQSLTEARAAVASVVPERQAALNALLASVQSRWETWMAATRQRHEAEFQTLMTGIEPVAATLAYDRGPAGVAAMLRQLEPGLRDVSRLAAPPVAGLRLSAEARQRHDRLTHRVAAFAEQVERWQQLTNGFRNPSSLGAYLEALGRLQQSEFASATDRTRASAVLALRLSTSALHGGLLLPGKPEAWARFEAQPEPTHAPAQVLPGERTLYNRLRDDDLLHRVHRHRLTEKRPAPDQAPATWEVFSMGPLVRTNFGFRIGTVFDPVVSAEEVQFHPRKFDPYYHAVEELGPAPEAGLMTAIGLDKLVERGTSTNYSGTLLGVLDALNRTDLGNPACRAYVAVRLHGMLELRPTDWGLDWAPSAVSDRVALRALGADRIAPGDWLDARRSGALAARLGEHFVGARRVGYLDQARFLETLARAVIRAGFVLVGNADAEGNARLPSAPPAGSELWGWAEGSSVPALLFRMRPGPGGAVAVRVTPAMPLGPLFVLGADRRKLLAETREAFVTDGARVGSYLPPLFAAAHE